MPILPLKVATSALNTLVNRKPSPLPFDLTFAGLRYIASPANHGVTQYSTPAAPPHPEFRSVQSSASPHACKPMLPTFVKPPPPNTIRPSGGPNTRGGLKLNDP